MQDLRHKILLVLTALTIIAEVVSIILWIRNPPLSGEPQARFSLAVNYTIAVADAAVFAVLNLIALVWIIRRDKMGPIFLIAISIINSYFKFHFHWGRPRHIHNLDSNPDNLRIP